MRYFPLHRAVFFRLIFPISSCQPNDRMHRALQYAQLRDIKNSRVARIAAKIDEHQGARVTASRIIVSRVTSENIETSAFMLARWCIPHHLHSFIFLLPNRNRFAR